MSVSGISAALIMTKLLNETSSNLSVVLIVLLAILVALIVSLACGFINGLLIGYIGVPPILATLGTMSMFLGVGVIITGARGIVGFPPGFLKIGTGTIYQIPIPFLIFIVMSLLMALILNKSAFGLKLYMLGSNPIASIFTGINNKLMLLKTYMMGGFMAGICSYTDRSGKLRKIRLWFRVFDSVNHCSHFRWYRPGGGIWRHSGSNNRNRDNSNDPKRL